MKAEKNWKEAQDIRTYPALISKEDNAYCVLFPDLPGCLTQADTLEGALVQAKDALAGWLFYSERDGDTIPAPTDIRELKMQSGQISALISVRMDALRKEETARGTHIAEPAVLRTAQPSECNYTLQ
ncbi:MAG: type II toxin-antitoxin system HicB family antitoxin [Synergistaceae bacterium]|nr:type II toxin-antitoxin system HicB family antitoxin [Synergistaceae bacterium]